MTQKTMTTPTGNQAGLSRAEEPDALDAILPFDRRDQLAELLTDDDVATLKHLAREAWATNTIERWPRISLSRSLVQSDKRRSPALANTRKPAAEIRRPPFVGYRELKSIPSHGMPRMWRLPFVQRPAQKTGPHAPATVRRRLTSWSSLTRWRDWRAASRRHR